MVQARNLHKVFSDRPRLNIVTLRLGYPSKKVHRVRVTQIESKRSQHVFLRPQDLFLDETAIRHEEEVLYGGTDDFFVFGGDEETGDTDELEFGDGDDAGGEEAIDHVDSEEEGFREESELVVDFDEPVGQGRSHFPSKIGLIFHVIRVSHSVHL